MSAGCFSRHSGIDATMARGEVPGARRGETLGSCKSASPTAQIDRRPPTVLFNILAAFLPGGWTTLKDTSEAREAPSPTAGMSSGSSKRGIRTPDARGAPRESVRARPNDPPFVRTFAPRVQISRARADARFPRPRPAYRSRERPATRASTRRLHPASGSPVDAARARSPHRTLTRAMWPPAPATGGCSRQPSTIGSTRRRGRG